jgi:anti-repressor protein
MSAELVPFVFDGREVRTVTINGEGWFVAADVTAVLKFGNSRQAIASHVDADDRDAVQILSGRTGLIC